MIDEPVEALQRVLPRFGNRPRAIGRARGVAEIGDGFLRQLIQDGPGHGQSAIAGIEDPDGCIHGARA